MEFKGNILAVDDDMTSIMLLEAILKKHGHNVITAHNGKETFDILNNPEQKVDIVLLDRELPDINGIEIVKQIKKNSKISGTPIIMQTSSDQPEQIKQGIDAGVFYYLTKPIEENLLKSILNSAFKEANDQKKLKENIIKNKSSINLINYCEFDFKTLEEAKSLSVFIANLFPKPEKVLIGITELLINAVEHGNCGITYDKKTEMVRNGNWESEVIRLLQLEKNINKKVNVIFKRKEYTISLIIRDEGDGFNWRPYVQIDPSRATDNHGRGIAQASMLCFDELKFNDMGNEVEAISNLEQPISW